MNDTATLSNVWSVMKRIRWGILAVILFFHVGALAAPFFFTWQMFLFAPVMWAVLGFGVTVGYHRGLAHRSYKTTKLVEYFWTFCGSFALHGGSFQWLETHLGHHADTEGQTDPHSPRHGNFWSYVGWKIFNNPKPVAPSRAWKNLERIRGDRVHIVLNKLFWLPSVVLGIVLYQWMDVSGVLWGICVPVVMGWHFTWAVNWVCHKWGKRRFDTTDDSRNNWWLCIPTLGESFHHNHHYKPNSARHGFAWYEFDFSWYVIKGLRACGMVWAVIIPRK